MVVATAGVASANGDASGTIYVPIDIGGPVDVRVLICSSIGVIAFVDSDIFVDVRGWVVCVK
jgi:hypothetical protein